MRGKQTNHAKAHQTDERRKMKKMKKKAAHANAE